MEGQAFFVMLVCRGSFMTVAEISYSNATVPFTADGLVINAENGYCLVAAAGVLVCTFAPVEGWKSHNEKCLHSIFCISLISIT